MAERSKIMDRNRKAQEEMLGFAFVIVLVVIIGFVILFLTLRPSSSPVEKESARVNNLLNSISYFTTNCEKRNVQQIILSCRRGELACGQDSCGFVKGQISGILGEALEGDYSFSVEITGEGEQQVLLELKKEENGECPGQKSALAAISVLPESTIVKLTSCPEKA
mgnify:CR=1 FL=1